MSRRFVLAVAVLSGFAAQSRAVDPKMSLSNLSLEAAALQTMHRVGMTRAQLESLQKLAADTAPKPTPRQDGKASGKVRQALGELREALLRGDADRIEILEERLDDLLDAEDADLDDEVTITPTARRRTAEVTQSLSPRQMAAFLNNLPEELPDPLERLLIALEAVGKLKDEQWKEFAEETVDELSWQLGGLDPDRSKLVGERIGAYLKTMRSLSPNEFRKQRPELEKAARQFVGSVSPAVVLHNVTEHALAELLSNPRLAAALEARLRMMK